MTKRLFYSFGFLIIMALSVSMFSNCGSVGSTLYAVSVEDAVNIDYCVDDVALSGTRQFNATIWVDGVDQGVDNSAVTWAVSSAFTGNIGSVSSAGLYTAPSADPADQVIVTATSISDTQKENRAFVFFYGSCP